jgi:predicted GIY-YIG superfamily endonuclease
MVIASRLQQEGRRFEFPFRNKHRYRQKPNDIVRLFILFLKQCLRLHPISKTHEIYYVGSTPWLRRKIADVIWVLIKDLQQDKDWEIVLFWIIWPKSLAIAREQEIKKWKSKA